MGEGDSTINTFTGETGVDDYDKHINTEMRYGDFTTNTLRGDVCR